MIENHFNNTSQRLAKSTSRLLPCSFLPLLTKTACH